MLHLVAVLVGCLALVSPAATLADSSPPTIESASASDVTERDATLEAKIDPNGLETTYEFRVAYLVCQPHKPGTAQCWAVVGFTSPRQSIAAGSETRTVSLDLDSIGVELQPRMVYEYSVRASNAAGEAPSPPCSSYNLAGGCSECWSENLGEGCSEESFETLPIHAAPSGVRAGGAVQTPDGFRLSGELNPNNLLTTYYFEYGPSTCEQLPSCSLRTEADGPLEGEEDQVVSPREDVPLAAGATFWYRLVARNADGTETSPLAWLAIPPEGHQDTSRPPELEPGSGPTTNSSPLPSATSRPSELPTAKLEPKPLTRAQLRERALELCKRKPRRRREACKRLADKRYGAVSGKHHLPRTTTR